MTDDLAFRRRLMSDFTPRPLAAGDPKYQPLYTEQSDVVLRIQEGILLASGTATTQLLSGYRGSGKSTELARLDALLSEHGYFVARFDIEDYLDLYIPLDITDFLLAICGALGECLRQTAMLGDDPVAMNVWERFWNWMNSSVDVSGLSVRAGAPLPATLELKAELHDNPDFRRKVRAALATNLSGFLREVRSFVNQCVAALRQRHGEDAQLVVIIDSVEHAAGTNDTEHDVHAALERMFSQHHDSLKLPHVHTVYTVPPWLRIRCPNVGAYYDGGRGLHTLPAQKVCDYDATRTHAHPYEPGVASLVKLIGRRGDWRRLLGDEDKLKRLIAVSGGHLRDLMRLLQDIVVNARTEMPVSDAIIESSIEGIRAGFLPIANNDAVWLAQIARTGRVELEGVADLPTLSRYFNAHLVLCYLNGSESFDVHPIVRDRVLEQADRQTAQRAAPSGDAP